MDEHEQLVKKLRKAVDRVFEKEGLDKAYFNLRFEMHVLEGNMRNTYKSYVIIDDRKRCSFCDEKTYYFDNTNNLYYCARCKVKP